MNQCDYLLCLKQLPMFNEVPLSIVAALLKNGTFIRGSSDQSPSFLHSQSVYIVLKGSIRFKDSRLPEGSQTVALWEKGAVFPVDEKGGLSLSPFISVNASPDITPYSIFYVQANDVLPSAAANELFGDASAKCLLFLSIVFTVSPYITG